MMSSCVLPPALLQALHAPSSSWCVFEDLCPHRLAPLSELEGRIDPSTNRLECRHAAGPGSALHLPAPSRCLTMPKKCLFGLASAGGGSTPPPPACQQAAPCSYHSWQFGPAGRCDRVPQAAGKAQEPRAGRCCAGWGLGLGSCARPGAPAGHPSAPSRRPPAPASARVPAHGHTASHRRPVSAFFP